MNIDFLIRFTGYGLLVLIVAPIIVIMAYGTWLWVADFRYARDFFSGQVDVVGVVASKRWHDFGEPTDACTYAAVEFSERTVELLQSSGPTALSGELREIHRGRWNFAWERTPATGLSKHVYAPFRCLEHLPGPYSELIARSLREPGSWYYEGHDVGTFLSADHRLAVTLRYGD